MNSLKQKRRFQAPKARPGEMRLVDFNAAEARRCGVSRAVIYERVASGKYPGLKFRKPHLHFVFVTVPKKALMPSNLPQSDELPLKVFVMEEAARNGESESAVYMRINRGGYAGRLEFRRVNRRVIFVKSKLG